MAAPIVVEWQVLGIKRVLESFSSVAKASEAAERQTARSVQNETATRTRGARSHEQLQEKKARDLQRALDKEARAAEKLESAKAKQSEKANILAARANDKRLQQDVRAAEKAERDKYSARERFEKRALDLQTRTARMTGKLAADQVREEMAMRARFTGGVASSVIGSVRGVIGTAARVGGSILALGGGFSMVDAVQQSVRNSGRAKELELNSGGAVTRDQVLKVSSSVATASGMPTGSVIDALDAFVNKSGDAKAGLSAIKQMAELALATGADLKDLATVAGQAQTGTKDIKVTMDMLREIAGMGRAGSVDVRELAQYGSRIFAGASQFEDVRTSTRTIGAMVQAAASGSGGATGAAEASEAAPHLAADMFAHEEAFKSLKGGGVNIRSKKNPLLLGDLKEILKKTLVATGGDFGQLQELFGQRSVKGVSAFSSAYVRSGEGLSGPAATEVKLKAVDKVFAEFEKAGMTAEQTHTEAMQRLTETDKQLEIVLNQLREAVGTQLVPEIVKLIPKINGLIEPFTMLLQKSVEFAGWLAKNPYSGIGQLIAGKVSADLALAGIGSIAAKAVATSLGAALSTIAIPLVAITAAVATIKVLSAKEQEEQKADVQAVITGGNESRDLLAKVRAGTATDEDKAALQKLGVKTQEQLSDVKGRQADVGKVLGIPLASNIDNSPVGIAISSNKKSLGITAIELQDTLDVVNRGLREFSTLVPNLPKPQSDQSRGVPIPARVK